MLLHPVLVLQFQIGFQVDIAIPEVFVGGLLGSMLIFLFSAWACAAVGRTAQEVVKEVRRQFIERPGIMVSINSFSNLCIVLQLCDLSDAIVSTFLLQDYTEKPDYGRCVAIVASASLKEMIKPGALAIVSPIVVGGLTALVSLPFFLYFHVHNFLPLLL